MDWIRLMGSTFYQEAIVKNKLIKFIQNASQLSMGEQCRAYEKEFAHYQGTDFCITYNSGSSANLALIQALMNLNLLKKGDKVAFSALTWATNVMPLIQLGLEPIPVDVETNTINVSSTQLLKLLSTDQIKAFFITNALGFCDDLDRIQEVCRQKNILLLEDNCESLGSVYKGTKLGNYGLASTFSYFVGHHLSTIEGGAVCTSDKKLADALIMVRAHGWDRNLEENTARKLRLDAHIDDFYARYTFYDLAYNFRPTEINAFIGREQLKTIDETVILRVNHYNVFQNAARNNPDIIPLETSHMDLVSNFAFPIVFQTPELQRKYILSFAEKKVEVRPIIGGNMCSQPFFKKYIKKEYHMPHSEFIHQNGVYFPNHAELSSEEIDRLASLISKRSS